MSPKTWFVCALPCAFVFHGLEAAGSTPPTDATQYYYVTEPSNWDCASSLQFCTNVEFTFTGAQHGDGCLSFFAVTDGTVELKATGSSGQVLFIFFPGIGPGDGCGEESTPECDMGSAGIFDEITLSSSGVVFLLWDPDPDDHGHLSIEVKEGALTPCPDIRDCADCLPAFNPTPDRTYVVSAWCNVPGAPAGTATYAGTGGPVIDVIVTAGGNTTVTIPPSGSIIDGWQRMEGEIVLPSNATHVELELGCGSGTALFDDVRFFPKDASMKCIVYDQDLRMQAELDDRHYATIYEYDGEGKRTRVKKETERGVMTIQETRYNTSHIDP